MVDDRPIAQTGSILRYIDTLAGSNSKDGVTAAQADAAFEAAQEMPMAQIYVAVNLMEEAEAKATARAFKAALPQYLQHWAESLGNKKFFHGKFLSYPFHWMHAGAVHRCRGCRLPVHGHTNDSTTSKSHAQCA